MGIVKVGINLAIQIVYGQKYFFVAVLAVHNQTMDRKSTAAVSFILILMNRRAGQVPNSE